MAKQFFSCLFGFQFTEYQVLIAQAGLELSMYLSLVLNFSSSSLNLLNAEIIIMGCHAQLKTLCSMDCDTCEPHKDLQRHSPTASSYQGRVYNHMYLQKVLVSNTFGISLCVFSQMELLQKFRRLQRQAYFSSWQRRMEKLRAYHCLFGQRQQSAKPKDKIRNEAGISLHDQNMDNQRSDQL